MSLTTIPEPRSSEDRDGGAVLLLVLIAAIVLSLVVLALANFVAADLRYSQVVDARSKRLTTAESGIDYAVERLRLGQTLCATKAASLGDVSLNGANTGAVGTPLPQALNDTTTKITCERLDPTIADVAGWALVIANHGGAAPSDQIKVGMNGTAVIDGPVFLPDVLQTDTDIDSRVEVVDGDLWYTRATCNAPYSNAALAAEFIDIATPAAHGGICTPRISGSAFSDPPPPGVLTDNPPFVDVGGCRVFSPGRYTTFVPLGFNNYFKSGEYRMAYPGVGIIENNRVIWAGGPGPSTPSPQTSNAACVPVRNADTANGAGATIYFEAGSTVKVLDGGALEVFGRRQGNHIMSIQGLYDLGGDPALLTTEPAGSVDVVMHGLVWAPYNRVVLENSNGATSHRFLGGIVVSKLHILNVDVADLEIKPATSTGVPPSAGDTKILLTSTSTSDDGVSTTVEAVVDYRPHATNLDDRVAVSSFRVVD